MTQRVTVSELRKKYEDLKCTGVVALIDYLERQRKAGCLIARIGSATIDYQGIARKLRSEEHTAGQAAAMIFSLPTFFFGSLDGTKTALDQLVELSETAHELKEPEFTRFNLFCADLATDEEKEFKVILSKSVAIRPIQ